MCSNVELQKITKSSISGVPQKFPILQCNESRRLGAIESMHPTTKPRYGATPEQSHQKLTSNRSQLLRQIGWRRVHHTSDSSRYRVDGNECVSQNQRNDSLANVRSVQKLYASKGRYECNKWPISRVFDSGGCSDRTSSGWVVCRWKVHKILHR